CVIVGRSKPVQTNNAKMGSSRTTPRGTLMNAPSSKNAVLRAMKGASANVAWRPKCSSRAPLWTALARLPAVTPDGRFAVEESSGEKRLLTNTSREPRRSGNGQRARATDSAVAGRAGSKVALESAPRFVYFQ